MRTIAFEDLDGVVLHDMQDYVIEFDVPFDDAMKEALLRHGQVFQTVGDKAGILNFGNYIGKARFLDKIVKVESRKLEESDYHRMLADIAGKMAELPFAFGTPTHLLFDMDEPRNSQVLYHAYLMLKYLLFSAEVIIEEACAAIFHQPHYKLVQDPVTRPVWDLRQVTSRTFTDLFSNPQHLHQIQPQHPLVKTGLAGRLVDPQQRQYFPVKVTQTRQERCYDTHENRLVKYFLTWSLGVLESFQGAMSDRIHGLEGQCLPGDESLLEEMMAMQAILDKLLGHSLFQEVDELNRIPYASTTLQKASGYQEIFRYYLMMQHAINLPVDEKDLQAVVENKDVATLYEIWTFTTMIDLLEKALDTQATIGVDVIMADYFSAEVRQRSSIHFKTVRGVIKLWYNRTFTRKTGSYSVALRPDLVLEVGEDLYIFDAKFKMEMRHWMVIEQQPQEEAMSDESDTEKSEDTMVEKINYKHKNEDIYKMHTYKDAIKRAKMACILYPNPDPKESIRIYENEEDDGVVGAIPMHPRRIHDELIDFLRRHTYDQIVCCGGKPDKGAGPAGL